jgi:hypothetical protein
MIRQGIKSLRRVHATYKPTTTTTTFTRSIFTQTKPLFSGEAPALKVINI